MGCNTNQDYIFDPLQNSISHYFNRRNLEKQSPTQRRTQAQSLFLFLVMVLLHLLRLCSKPNQKKKKRNLHLKTESKQSIRKSTLTSNRNTKKLRNEKNLNYSKSTTLKLSVQHFLPIQPQLQNLQFQRNLIINKMVYLKLTLRQYIQQ